MVIAFGREGFLSPDAEWVAEEIRSEFSSYFDLSKEVNKESHRILFDAKIHNQVDLELVSATLFVRILEHHRATFVLLERGIVSSAKVALRALLEAVFTLRAVVDESDKLDAYIKSDLVDRSKMLRALETFDEVGVDLAPKKARKDLLDEISKAIQDTGARKLKVEDLARFAGLHAAYQSHYRLLSSAVHTSVGDLECYFDLRSNGEVGGLAYAPELTEIPPHLMTACEFTLIAAKTTAAVFEMALSDQFKKIERCVTERADALIEARRLR